MRILGPSLPAALLLTLFAAAGAQATVLLRVDTCNFQSSCANGGPAGGDRALDPGETADMTIAVWNDGDEDATNVQAVLSSPSSGIAISRPSASYGTIAPGTFAFGATSFGFAIDSTVPCGTDFVFVLDLASHQQTTSGGCDIAIPPACTACASSPLLSLAGCSPRGACSEGGPGDADSNVDPGEIVTITPAVENTGAPATNVEVYFYTSTPGVVLLQFRSQFGDVGSFQVVPGQQDVVYAIDPAVACDGPITLEYQIFSAESPSTGRCTHLIPVDCNPCRRPTEANCADGLDDDGDGFADCTDSDCIGTAACPAEDCGNRLDDNGDGATDCADASCFGFPGCARENCTNGADDDGDAFTDCADPDCLGHAACRENCANGLDDDADTLVDCADSDCTFDPACGESCTNGLDDDGDTLVDCADPDCLGTPGCTPENCSNGVDDDGDSWIDCQDADCIGAPACTPEDCANGVDDDGDTLVDCADPGCAGDPACGSENCTNGTDDDGDGAIDCRDTECITDPACAGQDFDGDGAANSADCAPVVATVWAIPAEVPGTAATHLVVARVAGSSDVSVRWPDLAAQAGTATVYDLISGLLSGLRSARSVIGASCLGNDQPAAPVADSRLPGPSEGYFYLVRGDNACGQGPYGFDSMGTRLGEPVPNDCP